MADTTTPNLVLLIADLNDVFNFGAHVEANFTTIDGLMGAVQCTSSARPTNTYAGQIVYETDSKRYAQNTGTKAAPAWTYMSHQAIAAASSSRPTVGLTAGELLYETDNALVRPRGASAWLGNLCVATSGALPANPIQGDLAYLSDKDCLIRYTGSAWRLTSIVTCTSGTRPTLSLAAGTMIYETDTTRFLIYNGSAWEQKAFANFVCTSSTHPASPYQGMEIFETDTGLTAVYNGSSFLYGAQQIATTQVITTNTASVTFSGISSAYTTVSVLWTARDNSGNTNDALALRFNGDSGLNYGWQYVEGNNTTASAAVGAAGAASFIQIGICAGGSATAGYFSSGRFDVGGWNQATSSSRKATAVGTSYIAANTGAGGQITGTYGGTYSPSAALTSLTLLPNNGSFVAGSEFSLLASM